MLTSPKRLLVLCANSKPTCFDLHGDRHVTYLSLASVSLLMIVHILVGHLHFLEQERWRSVGAGIAMSYVFLDILPHLSSKQYLLEEIGRAHV